MDLSSTSLPSQRTRGMSSAAGNGEGSSNRMSMMARGMVPYVATEKDCTDEEGNEAECVICFEEFEAGDKMARLVCWCKFHEVSWPVTHPTLKQTYADNNIGLYKGMVEEKGQRSVSDAPVAVLVGTWSGRTPSTRLSALASGPFGMGCWKANTNLI